MQSWKEDDGKREHGESLKEKRVHWLMLENCELEVNSRPQRKLKVDFQVKFLRYFEVFALTLNKISAFRYANFSKSSALMIPLFWISSIKLFPFSFDENG